MSSFDLTPPTEAQHHALAATLTDAERRVLLEHGTEAAFCGVFLDNKQDGVYTCRLCGLPLFRSSTKFDSGTGWPSFFAPYDPAHVRVVRDTSYGMIRDEIVCARCGSHLGHVFPDGAAYRRTPLPQFGVAGLQRQRQRAAGPAAARRAGGRTRRLNCATLRTRRWRRAPRSPAPAPPRAWPHRRD